MRTWVVVAVWVAWLVFAGGVGVARSKPGDKVDDRGTRVWADASTVAALLGAVVLARCIPRAGMRVDPWLPLVLGSAVVVLGIVVRRWAARTLGRFFTQSVATCEGHRVITTGPYRCVRHPGYTGMLVSMIGLGLTLGNWLSVTAMFVGFFAGHLPRIRVEELVLEGDLGDEYRAFQRTRKRLIPGIW